ncbi:diacylglycerol kinase [Effusibacillus dendaii]|uniref:Diacylglycerol kinase n=1 Tax=Effusibacillus dendaii TaxID=2743772 RepID=A0A7I8DE49_9BACL|nr:diacylglycerol kinase [Effusibacillus dendaii]BCJ87106.1 diacylglycerol kinase [Effusibacillus dendaii]
MVKQRARLIYNPSSGKEMMRQQLPEILDIFDSAGLETTCHMTKNSDDTVEAAKRAAEEAYDLVIAAGGDGTVNEVVNGLSPFEVRPLLGILPAGTSNDLSRALGLPRDLKEAARRITDLQYKPLDVGQVNDRFFINIAGCGRITEITYEVPSRMKTALGQLAYYMKGLEKIPQLGAIHLEIEAASFGFSGKAMLCLICNSNRVGGFENIAPDANLADGLFDVMVVKQASIPDMIRLATQALRGEHVHNERVLYFQTEWLKVTSKEKVELNLDGEYGGTLPKEFRVLKHHLQVVV